MRMMLTVHTDTETGTELLKNGRAAQTVREALERLKPEAAYFFLDKGKRTTLFVLDLAEPSEIIPLVEPLFAQMKAEVSLTPVMNADDLFAGLAFGEPSGHVGLGRGVPSEPADGDDVEGGVGGAVAASVEPVSLLSAGGRVAR